MSKLNANQVAQDFTQQGLENPRNTDSTVFLGHLFQCLTVFTIKSSSCAKWKRTFHICCDRHLLQI